MMRKILFHCGVGNSDRPHRWSTINRLFTSLSGTLRCMGYETHMIIHSAAKIPENDSHGNVTIMDKVNVDHIKKINPDIGFTWNGNSPGDREFIKSVGGNKMIYGELGYFDHYNKTLYFDRSGVNTRHSMLGSNEFLNYNLGAAYDILNMLMTKHVKPRIIDESFIFVPLQDETDTQITQYSPFKTMDAFLHHVRDIFVGDDRPILYKLHPRAPAKVTLNDPKFKAVTEDVHHYIPYADLVFGINSTVMVETLLYHSRIVPYGAGLASRHLEDDEERVKFVASLYSRQMLWDDLRSEKRISNSYLHGLMREI